jgi:tetratricopeptide (TPR) repeat protein
MPDLAPVIVELDESIGDPLEAVRERLPEGSRGPILLLGLERSNPSRGNDRPVLRELNLQRPLWRELGRPVVLWVPEYLLALLGHEAPDFIDWRSDTLEFPVSVDAPGTERVFEPSLGVAASDLPAEAADRRIEELEFRLRSCGGDGLSPTEIDWRVELAQLLIQRGHVERALGWLELGTSEGAGRAELLVARGRIDAMGGGIQAARAAFEEALAIFEAAGDEQSRAVTLGYIARLQAQSGDVSGALALHEERLSIFESLGDVRSRAVTLGDIARMKAQSGDLSGALALHEEQLSIFESLGDVHSRAVTLGDLANMRMEMGQSEEARRLQEEQLEVTRRLGDTDGIAAALFGLARIDLAAGDFGAAIPRLAESWSLLLKLGRADALVRVGTLLGPILLEANAKEEASHVLGTAEAAARKLGWTDRADHLATLLAQANASED